MASVVGIDFGALASKIGIARKKGIDIILNESSNRATPSLISFGPKQRSIGEAAKTLETSNYKNTIGSLKRLVGRKLSDPDIAEIEQRFITANLVDVDGFVGVKVNYLGEPAQFSANQLVAMYLGKLRDIAANELKSPVCDVVIAVPGWFTEIQRRAIYDAALIAGLNPLRLINDSTAVAFSYGITKSDLPELDAPSRNVVFVDVGHSNYTVSVVAYNKGQLVVKSTAYDPHLGGRDIDYALVRHFAAEFKEKYKIDVLGNPKATFRLSAQCERLKKILSANAESPLSVESIVNDVDATSKLSREQLESLIPEVLARITPKLEEALREADITVDDVHSVELVGGSSRVPAIRERIKEFFGGKTLSTTLNADEAVARGATFSCAQQSPAFRLKDFSISDVNAYPVRVQWERAPGDLDNEDTELLVFPRGNAIPSTKVLTFSRNSTFDLEAVYADPAVLPGKINPWVGKVTVKDPSSSTALATVKVKLRINANGLFSFEDAWAQDETEPTEEEIAAAKEGEAPKRKVTKRKLAFVAGNLASDPAIIASLKEKENSMHSEDKLVIDTEDRKNALEEYVYDMRSKLEGKYAQYAQAAEKEKLLAALSEAEDWLYSEEGEDALKSAYVSRLDALHALGNPIAARYTEKENRGRVLSSLRDTINLYMSQATSGDERWDHIDAKEKESVVERAAVLQKWLDDNVARQAERPLDVDPVLREEEVEKKRQELIYFATPIFSKLKPKPKNTSETATPQPEPEKPAEPAPEEGPTEMDVD